MSNYSVCRMRINKRKRENRIKNQLCIECGKEKKDNKTSLRCNSCIEYHKKYNKKRYLKSKKEKS